MQNCVGCGQPIYGDGYHPHTIRLMGTKEIYCCRRCYERSVSPEEKASNETNNKIVIKIFGTLLGLACPPILLLVYWDWTWAITKWIFRTLFGCMRFLFGKIVFTKFFWKYIAPIIAVAIGIAMFLAHRAFVRRCEKEMQTYFETAQRDISVEIGKIKQERKSYLEEKAKQRAAEEQRRKTEEEHRRQELAKALSAAKEEQLRQKIAQDTYSFAKENLPEKWKELSRVREEMVQLEQRINTARQGVENSKWEEKDENTNLLKDRNRLLRKIRHLEVEVETAFNHRQK